MAHDKFLDVGLLIEQETIQRHMRKRREVQLRKIDRGDNANIYVTVKYELREGLWVRCEGAEDLTLHRVLPELDERVSKTTLRRAPMMEHDTQRLQRNKEIPEGREVKHRVMERSHIPNVEFFETRQGWLS